MTKKFLYQNVHKSERVGEHNERARTPRSPKNTYINTHANYIKEERDTLMSECSLNEISFFLRFNHRAFKRTRTAQHAVVHHSLSLFFLWSTAIESIRHTNVPGALFILAKSFVHNQLKNCQYLAFVTGLERVNSFQIILHRTNRFFFYTFKVSISGFKIRF